MRRLCGSSRYCCFTLGGLLHTAKEQPHHAVNRLLSAMHVAPRRTCTWLHSPACQAATGKVTLDVTSWLRHWPPPMRSAQPPGHRLCPELARFIAGATPLRLDRAQSSFLKRHRALIAARTGLSKLRASCSQLLPNMHGLPVSQVLPVRMLLFLLTESLCQQCAEHTVRSPPGCTQHACQPKHSSAGAPAHRTPARCAAAPSTQAALRAASPPRQG